MANIDTFLSLEFIRFYLVFIHIMAATLAVGCILFSYIDFYAYDSHLSKKRVLLEHKTVGVCLLVLVLSGLSIVYVDVGIIKSFTQLFSYQKLTAKLLDVSILVCNGIFIRAFIIPKILDSKRLSRKVTIIFGASAGASLACWINAIFLGKAKILVKIMDLNSFIMMDLMVVFVGIVVGAISSFFIQVKINT